MAISEFSFSVDDFQNPKVYKDPEAIATLLVRLVLLEPGTIQSHPDMGVGINSRYKYSVEGGASELQSDIERQIEKYLPQFSGAEISVTEQNSTYYIYAKIGSVLYAIYFDKTSANIKTGYTKLDNL